MPGKLDSATRIPSYISPHAIRYRMRMLDNPSYISPHAIRYRMRMLGFGGEFSAMAGVGLEEKWVDWFKNGGIIIIPPRAHIMPVDIVLWAMENPATFFQPRTLVVFSDNVKEGTDLYNALEALLYRNYNVFVFKLSHRSRPPVFIWPSCSTRKSATLSSAILSGLRNKGIVFFRPYLDMDSGPVPMVTRMLLDIIFWAMNYDDQPLNVMLITQDKCDFVMQALERRGFNVIFIPPSHRIDSFESVYRFACTGLLDDCPSNPDPEEFRFLFSSTIREKGYPNCESVSAYVDKSNFSGDLIKLYRNSGLRVRCVPKDDEMEKITLMSLDMISLPHHGQFNILVLFSECCTKNETLIWGAARFVSRSYDLALSLKGIFDAFVKIIREEGPTELYRGLAPSLIGVVPYTATNYFAYDSLRKAYRSFSKKEKIGNIETLLIGSLAGALSSTATFPLEVARKHMQVAAVSGRVVYKNMLDALVRILEHEGILGWYKGLGPSCLKLVPAAGISFMCYEACKKILVENSNQED
ncbi:hypothetical protein DY000_02036801 [Brassica cretica]|uniref:Uncharacterized protein n=1 Tax=Brassica cretica TaxID=69181 RepID=A0ABQ7BP78_BRACR|nr:hypothetical protein DY000_02036801 [Brassica cretica]